MALTDDQTDLVLKVLVPAGPFVAALLTPLAKTLLAQRREPPPSGATYTLVQIPPGLGELPKPKSSTLNRLYYTPIYPLILGAPYVVGGYIWDSLPFLVVGWITVGIGGLWGYGWVIRRVSMRGGREIPDTTVTAAVTVGGATAEALIRDCTAAIRSIRGRITELDLDHGTIEARWRGTYYMLHYALRISWVNVQDDRIRVTFHVWPQEVFKPNETLLRQGKIIVRRLVENFVGIPVYQEKERDRLRRLRLIASSSLAATAESGARVEEGVPPNADRAPASV